MDGSQSESSERKGQENGPASVKPADLAKSTIKPSSSSAHHPHVTSARSRWPSRLRKFFRGYRIAVVLFLLSLLGFGFAWMRYPHASEIRKLSTPGFVIISINTNTNNDQVLYVVRRKASSATLTITAIAKGKAEGQTLGFSLQIPHEARFLKCNPPSCTNKPYYPVYKGTLMYYGGHPTSTATTAVQVNAPTLSSDANGEEAVAVMPSLHYKGKGGPSLGISMDLAGANKYDWSQLPPSDTNKYGASWLEPLVNGQVEARIVSGANADALQNVSTRNFQVGLAIGIAGGALISAIQEALHTRLERKIRLVGPRAGNGGLPRHPSRARGKCSRSR
jgi:hypothetical protein